MRAEVPVRRWLPLALAHFVFGLLLIAAGPVPAAAEVLGPISGTVRAGGGPVAHAWVTLMPVTPTGDWAGRPATSTTDEAGRFTFAEPGSLHVKVQVRAPSFSGLADAYWPQEYSFATAGILEVAPSGSTADVQLPPGARISGRVVEAGTGAPMVGARVLAHVDAPPGWESVGGTGLASSTGDFVLEGIPPVPVALQVSAPSGGNHLGQWHDGAGYFGGATKVAPGASGVTIELTEGGQISGVVRSSAGEAVPGASVTVVGCPGLCPMSGVADAAGRYRIPAIPAGPGLRAYADGGDVRLLNGWYSSAQGIGDTSFDLREGEVLDGVDFALTVGALVTGAIVDAGSGEPISGVTVDLLSVDNPLRSFRSRVGQDPGAAPGSPEPFVIGPVPPGRYSVVVFPGSDNADYLPVQWVQSSGFDGPEMLDLAQGESAEVMIGLVGSGPPAHRARGPEATWPGARGGAPLGDAVGSGQWPGLARGFLTLRAAGPPGSPPGS